MPLPKGHRPLADWHRRPLLQIAERSRCLWDGAMRRKRCLKKSKEGEIADISFE